MIEIVNPKHPDKIADRIAGAIVDLCYELEPAPKVAVEILIGHGDFYAIIETSAHQNLKTTDIDAIVQRITEQPDWHSHIQIVPQDPHLANNQKDRQRAGDNGIFSGLAPTIEEQSLAFIAHALYDRFNSDGKYILDRKGRGLIISQSNATDSEIRAVLAQPEIAKLLSRNTPITINPLGPWTGGLDVDTGAVNRKLGSDMGHAVTGGGLHGKDLTKADVSVNLTMYALALVNDTPRPHRVQAACAIGDEKINDWSYDRYIDIARQMIKNVGGFEKLAEWGLHQDFGTIKISL